MVEVFATNIPDSIQAEKIILALNQHFPQLKINVDLVESEFPSACNILRVEGPGILPGKIIEQVNRAGFSCEILEDKVCK